MKEGKTHRNHLADQTSLYLRQHAANPIDWYPWGEEALKRAREENRPIFLSVGYSSCHWCHVMEREVFEKQDVADFMNERFISIKVDREERPDIDALYMEALMALTGGGGWPMSVFLTPDLKPFHAGTYYPHQAFLSLVRALHQAYTEKTELVARQAGRLHGYLSRQPEISAPHPVPGEWIREASEAIVDAHDPRHGGLAGRMKFPTPLAWLFVMHRYRRSGDRRHETALVRTLDAMASGGIHDHLEGGFHRYTVESTWLIPHFEKMLYDSALLAMLYAEASVILDQPRYEEVARTTLEFMTQRMGDRDGGFHSSLDADSGGEEGSYYVWTPGEIRDVAGDDAEALAMLLGVTEQGNFEGRSVLTRRVDASSVSEQTGMDLDRASRLFHQWRPELLQRRRRRAAPTLDRKIITSWNALAIVALVRGYNCLGESRFLQEAVRASDRLWNTHRTRSGAMLRASSEGKAGGPGVLEDHAAYAWSQAELFVATSDPVHLKRARTVLDDTIRLFRHPEAGFYHSSEKASEGLPRQVRFSDSARPSGNATMLHVLIMMEALTGRSTYREMAEKMLGAYAGIMRSRGADMSWWWDAADLLLHPYHTVVVAGPEHAEGTRRLVDRFHALAPHHAVLLRVATGSDGEDLAHLSSLARDKQPRGGKPTAYVCQWGRCKAPTSDPDEMEGQILTGLCR